MKRSAEIALGTQVSNKLPKREDSKRQHVKSHLVTRHRVFGDRLFRTGTNDGLRPNDTITFRIPNRRDALMPSTMKFTFSVALDYENAYARKTRIKADPSLLREPTLLTSDPSIIPVKVTDVDTGVAPLDEQTAPATVSQESQYLLLQNGEALQGGVQKLFRSCVITDGYGNVLDDCQQFNIAETVITKQQSQDLSDRTLVLQGFLPQRLGYGHGSNDMVDRGLQLIASRYNADREAFEYTVQFRTSWIFRHQDDFPIWATEGMHIHLKLDTDAFALIHRYRGGSTAATTSYRYQVLDAWVDYTTRRYSSEEIQRYNQQFESKQGLVMTGTKYSVNEHQLFNYREKRLEFDIDCDYSDVHEIIVNGYVFQPNSETKVGLKMRDQLAGDQMDSNLSVATTSVIGTYVGRPFPNHLSEYPTLKTSMMTRVSEANMDRTQSLDSLCYGWNISWNQNLPMTWATMTADADAQRQSRIAFRSKVASNVHDRSVVLDVSKTEDHRSGTGLDFSYNGNEPLRILIHVRDWLADHDTQQVPQVSKEGTMRIQIVLKHTVKATFRKGQIPNIAD